MSETPKFYQKLQKDYQDVMQAVDQLGKAVQDAGPLDEKMSQLIKLASCGNAEIRRCRAQPRKACLGGRCKPGRGSPCRDFARANNRIPQCGRCPLLGSGSVLI